MDTMISRRIHELPDSLHGEANANDDAIAAFLTKSPIRTLGTVKRAPTAREVAQEFGAKEGAGGMVYFGSWEAVRCFAMKIQRELAVAHATGHSSVAAPSVDPRQYERDHAQQEQAQFDVLAYPRAT